MSTDVHGISNGFRIYSPDSATWSGSSPGLVDIFLDDLFDLGGVNYILSDTDGVGSDTIGFGAATFYGDGLSTSYDYTAFSIRIGPIDSSMAGKTIIIDSSFFRPTNEWFWTDINGDLIYPDWAGPYQYSIEDPKTVEYSGNISYRDPRPNTATYQKPLRNIRIQMWDDDYPFTDDSLADTIANNLGVYSFDPIENEDQYGTLDVYFKVQATNHACGVYSDSGTCEFLSSIQSDVSHGVHTLDLITPSDSFVYGAADTNGSFFIADAITSAHQKFEDITGIDLPLILVNWEFNDSSIARFNPLTQTIYIPGKPYLNDWWPETYDVSVIYHEYGHNIAWRGEFFDDAPGVSHHWYDILDSLTAASEGFSHFYSALVNDDSIMNNYNFNFTKKYWNNIENGEKGIDSDTSLSVNNYGHKCEASVAGLLWDIYDEANDNYSTYLWPPLPCSTNFYNPDTLGIGDTLALGSDGIFHTLLTETINGHYPDDINEFRVAWNSSGKGHPKAVNDIYYEHGIIVFECGDANVDYRVNIGDVIYIINYIFKAGPPPIPLFIANANGDKSVNIGDAVHLINHIFKGGTGATGCENL